MAMFSQPFQSFLNGPDVLVRVNIPTVVIPERSRDDPLHLPIPERFSIHPVLFDQVTGEIVFRHVHRLL